MAYAEKYVLNHPSILKLILSHLLRLIKSPKNIYFQQNLMAWIVLRWDGEVLVAGDMVVGVVMGGCDGPWGYGGWVKLILKKYILICKKSLCSFFYIHPRMNIQTLIFK